MNKTALFKSICIIAFLILATWLLSAFPIVSKSSESGIKSSSLIVNMVEEGNVKRIEYLDADGKVTYASDKHFAVRIITLGEKERLDEFFDEKGNPARQVSGHYALLREYNDAGKVWRQTYLGADGKPIINRVGYAVVHRYYYHDGPHEGKIEEEFYFDAHEKPVKLSLGEYGVHKEYDEKGRNSVLTYLGADGQPILTNKGFTKVVRVFDENNKIYKEMYYDLDGNRVFILSRFLNAYPISVVLLGALVVLISLLMNKKKNVVLLIFYLVFIMYMTLMHRESGEARANLEIFWSYRQFITSKSVRQEILNNIWLFIPLGAVICRLKQKARFLLLPVVLSVGIEAVQYVRGVGLAEFDDVFGNVLGAVIGWVIVKYYKTLNTCKK